MFARFADERNSFLRDVTMLSEMREQMSVQKELLEAFQQLSTAGDAQELSRKTPKLFTSSAMIKLYDETLARLLEAVR